MKEVNGAEARKGAIKMEAVDDIAKTVDSSALMLVIYGLMVVSIIAIPFLYFAIYSGFIRFLLMFMALLILMLFLSARVAEKVPSEGIEKEVETQEAARTGLASMKKTVERAFEGYQSSQIILRDTLRDVLVRKIAMKKRMETWEVEEVCTRGGAKGLVADPELQKLLSERYVRPKGKAGGILKKLRKNGARKDDYRDFKRWLEEMMEKIEEV